MIALLNFVVLAAIFVPLERVFPARPEQKLLRRGLFLDVCFFVGQYVITLAAAFALMSWVSSHVRAGSMGNAPPWLQVVSALVLGDLVVYWFHRACHRFDFLWRFHAVHHSAEELDWLAAHREHPVDGVLTALCMNLPAILLGVRVELLAGVAVLRALWSIFVHSNVRIPLGPLRWILGAPELHHWHHARESRHNFANLAPWLDWLFGTHHHPEGEERYSLGIAQRMPRSYFAMIVFPFL
ncbi:MAG: sterol desaturase family protein [Polyangiales bacterium]